MVSLLPGNLKALRDKKGLSAQDVADSIGIGRANISHYENGVSNPSIETLSKLAKLFIVKVDDLLEKDLTDSEVINMVLEPNSIYNTGLTAADKAQLRGLVSGIEEMLKVVKEKLA